MSYALSFSTTISLQYCDNGAAVLGKADDDIGFLPGMSAVRVRDLPEGVVAGNLDSVFARLLHRMGQELHRAAVVAVNTFAGLDDAINDDHRRMFKACHLVGPLNLLSAPTPKPAEPAADLSGCLAWLDGQPSQAVAYISFGTLMSPPPLELAELAAGLEASGAPFLWALKEKHHAFLPAGFLEKTKGRGLVVAWAPQRQVLEHPAAGAFVTHCGWNSVMESVTGGVPMVCQPFLGDQRLNARSISAIWGVGVEMDGGRLTQEGVVAALSAVLGSEKGRGMRERISQLREAAAAAVQPGGSSAESLRELVGVVSRKCSIQVSLTS